MLRQCKWKGTDESNNMEGELTGVKVHWEGFMKQKTGAWSRLAISVSVMEWRQKGQRPLQTHHSRKHFTFMRANIQS